MKTTLKLGGLGCLLLALAACRSDQPAPTEQVSWAPVNSPIRADAKTEARITELLGQMSVEQKVGQLVQVEIRYITPAQVKQYHIGSILNGGGTFPNNDKYASETDWVNVAEAFYQASMDTSGGDLAIPVIWGTDAVHGHNNVIRATLFPHNIGLGATRNPELIRAIGSATAREVSATGVQWTFAPTVATPRDDRWGRTYEGYSEDPEIVRQFAAEMVKGIQGEAGTSELFSPSKMVATVKHFVGDGGTYMGRDRGDTKISELELRDIHAQGYFSGLSAGAQTVMASFNSWNGERLHGSFHMLTEVLKNQMGFDGFVVGDWNGHGFVPGCDFTSCPQAINAGLDMFMAIQEWHDLLENTIRQAKSGEIPMARLDDAVRRILRVKMRAGLFEGVSPKQRAVLNGVADVLGNPEHRALARQAVRESLVLALDRQFILNELLAGDGELMPASLLPGHWVANESLFPPAYSPDEARELLAKARLTDSDGDGWLDQNGRRVELSIRLNGENKLHQRLGWLAGSYYRELGLFARAESIPPDSLIDDLFTHDFDLAIFGWPMLPDPDQRRFWHSTENKEGEGLNFVSYNNPEVDDLLEDGVAVSGCQPEDRAEQYTQLQDILSRDRPVDFLLTPNQHVLVGTRLQGVNAGPFAPFTWNITEWFLQ